MQHSEPLEEEVRCAVEESQEPQPEEEAPVGGEVDHVEGSADARGGREQEDGAQQQLQPKRDAQRQVGHHGGAELAEALGEGPRQEDVLQTRNRGAVSMEDCKGDRWRRCQSREKNCFLGPSAICFWTRHAQIEGEI